MNKEKTPVFIKKKIVYVKYACPYCKWTPNHPEMIVSIPDRCFQCNMPLDTKIIDMSDA